MSDFTLDAKTTALVVIDLQKGIVGNALQPHGASDVVERSARLATRFRERQALVVLVNVNGGADGSLFPQPITDVPRPRMQAPTGWDEIVPELGAHPTDVRVTKHQPNAFFGTELDIHFRRRGIQTIVLCGISTNVGVEATARVGFEHGYNLVFVEDAMTARDGELHAASTGKFFPTIGRVRSTDQIVAALAG